MTGVQTCALPICLSDWEKDEVKKGNQDPWNFDEEDLEDDDYYSDDD